MSKFFDGKNKLMIILLLLILFGGLYYNFGIKRFQSEFEKYNTSKIEEENATEQAKGIKKKTMQDELDNAIKDSVGEIAVYDSQVDEVIELDSIFENTGKVISISWDDPSLSDTIVRRRASIRFEASSWEDVQTVVEKLADCKFRTSIDDMYIRIEGNNDYNFTNTEVIAATVSVTFFETIDGATTNEGLVNLN